MKVKVSHRNFYAKAVTRIAPKVEQSKKAYSRKEKHKNSSKVWSKDYTFALLVG